MTAPRSSTASPAIPEKLRAEARAALEKYFGFSEFRPGQEEIIEAVIAGQDALVIMPTGGGKSLCFQLPALLRDGVTLVVSPLIALMKDQVDALRARGIPAGFLNSSLSPSAQREVLRDMENGTLRLVYVAPERFRYEGFLQTIRRLPLSLFAIDEAHCISQWGHDFRPDYYRMGRAIEDLGRPQVVALTATASPAVQSDILHALHLDKARRFVAGFSRPNLSLRVRQVHSDAEKYARVHELVRALRTGIIYCATRKKVEAVAREMRHWKIPFVYYHGGLSDRERALAQEKFISGEAAVAIATNAFGMGIDRADLRFVIHFEIPGSIEAYYQEVGRAGRDGLPSTCELLFQHPDIRVQEFFLEGANPSIEIITSLWRVLREAAKDNEVALSLSDLAARIPGCKNEMSVGSAMIVLQRAGYVERKDIPGQLLRLTRLLQPDIMPHRLEIDRAALDEKERLDRERLRLMVDFVHSRECRQQFILRAFGEITSDRCGSCDRCKSHHSTASRPPTPSEKLALRKLLSCIARMSWRRGGEWEGRFGRQRIVQVLTGSRVKAVLEAGLDRLSTYGILREEGETYTADLLREAVEAGLAQVSSGQYPTISLTPEGEAAMRGADNYQMVWPGTNDPPAPARAKSKRPSRTEAVPPRRAFRPRRPAKPE